MKNKFRFLNWYVPIALIVLLISFYIYQIGYIQDRFGFKDETGGITLRPADEYQEYNAWFVVEGKPGDVVNERLYIRSHHSEAAKFAIFPLDSDKPYSPEDGTSFNFKSDEAVQKSLGLWTDFPINSIYLEPFDAQMVDFTINIPSDAEYGQYSGGIVTDQIEDREDLPDSVRFGAKINTRVGVRIYLNVTDDPEPRVVKMTREEISAEVKKISSLHMGIFAINLLFLIFLFVVGYSSSNKKNK